MELSGVNCNLYCVMAFYALVSVLVGAESSVFRRKKLPELDEEDNGLNPEEGAAVFSSSWLPEKKRKYSPYISKLFDL